MAPCQLRHVKQVYRWRFANRLFHMPHVLREKIQKLAAVDGHVIMQRAEPLCNQTRIRAFIGKSLTFKTYRKRANAFASFANRQTEQGCRVYPAAKKKTDRHIANHVNSTGFPKSISQLFSRFIK